MHYDFESSTSLTPSRFEECSKDEEELLPTTQLPQYPPQISTQNPQLRFLLRWLLGLSLPRTVPSSDCPFLGLNVDELRSGEIYQAVSTSSTPPSAIKSQHANLRIFIPVVHRRCFLTNPFPPLKPSRMFLRPDFKAALVLLSKVFHVLDTSVKSVN